MYKSPVEIEVKRLRTNLDEELGRIVLNAIQEVGVKANLDELAKAMAYDRNQYEKGRKDGMLDVLDDLSSAYYGKRMYFAQSDGTIYSRLSCGYMSFEKAMSEFCEAISMDGGAEG